MKMQVVASTKDFFELESSKALLFSGRLAGICYMKDTFPEIVAEQEEKTNNRIKVVLKNGHHSVFDHPYYTLLLEEVPKILAMFLNNEKAYTTSEKSARYTQMQLEGLEKYLYDKWVNILFCEIDKRISQNKCLKIKLAQENARYLISVFSPCTTMAYTASLRQLNYIASWFCKYILEEKETPFNVLLKPYLQDFIDELDHLHLLIPDLMLGNKCRSASFIDFRTNHAEEFGENYSTTYNGSFSMLAQAQRHRTLHYSMSLPDTHIFYTPDILLDHPGYYSLWQSDIAKLAERFPQGMLVKIHERGTPEDFILKCTERLCGNAQLEIMKQTNNTLRKYLKQTQESNSEIFHFLEPYSHGPRCTFPNWHCISPCFWGSSNAMKRFI